MSARSLHPYSIDSILAHHGSEGDLPFTGRPRRWRHRTVFTKDAIKKMEDLFEVTQYPDITQRETIAADIGVAEARVQVWFQNRRARLQKSKRSSLKMPSFSMKRHPQYSRELMSQNSACMPLLYQDEAGFNAFRPAFGPSQHLMPFSSFFAPEPQRRDGSIFRHHFSDFRPMTQENSASDSSRHSDSSSSLDSSYYSLQIYDPDHQTTRCLSGDFHSMEQRSLDIASKEDISFIGHDQHQQCFGNLSKDLGKHGQTACSPSPVDLSLKRQDKN